jgi:hypothetical protein
LKLTAAFLLVFFSFNAINSYAAIGRSELITYTLDYYTSGGKIEKKLFTQQKIDNEQEKEVNEVRNIKPQELQVARKNWVVIDRTKAFLKDVHSYVKVNAAHHGNIYMVHTDAKEDFVTTTDTGLVFKTKRAKNKLDIYVDGGHEITRYFSNTFLNVDHPYATGFIRGDLGKWNLGVIGGIDQQHSPKSILSDVDEKEYVKAWTYSYGADSKYKSKRFENELQYFHNTYAYKSDQYTPSNRYFDVLATKNSYRFLPRTKLFLEYSHGWFDNFKSDSNNWNYDKYWAGIESKFLRKFTSMVKYGYMATNHKVGRHEYGNTLSTILEYKPSERLTCYTKVIKGITNIDLLDNTVCKIRGVLLGTTFLPFSKNKRLRLHTEISYKEQDYEPDARQKYFNFFFNPEYKLKDGVKMGLRYGYNEKRCNKKAQEFIDNDLTFTLDYEF